MASHIRRIAVLGAGTMGHGIAHAAIVAGYETRLYDVSTSALDKARAAIEAIVAVCEGRTTWPEGRPRRVRVLTATG